MQIQIVPVPKPRMTQSDKWNQRDCVMRYRAFADELRLQWGNNPVPARLRLVFTMPMPQSWSQKKRVKFDGQPHQNKPDTDNLVKSCIDSLSRDLDDSFVWEIHAIKVWGIDGSIVIEELN